MNARTRTPYAAAVAAALACAAVALWLTPLGGAFEDPDEKPAPLGLVGMTQEQIAAVKDQPLTSTFWITVAGGFVLFALGYILCRLSFKPLAESMPAFEVLPHPHHPAPVSDS